VRVTEPQDFDAIRGEVITTRAQKAGNHDR
jgi:hypothetical protein